MDSGEFQSEDLSRPRGWVPPKPAETPLPPSDTLGPLPQHLLQVVQSFLPASFRAVVGEDVRLLSAAELRTCTIVFIQVTGDVVEAPQRYNHSTLDNISPKSQSLRHRSISVESEHHETVRERHDQLERLQKIFMTVASCVRVWSGNLARFQIDDKGVVFKVAFGLPPVSGYEELRAVMCSCEVKSKLALQGFGSSIGVTSGRLFAGVVGSPLRCEYTTVGSVVTLAARLMQRANGDILCDEITQSTPVCRDIVFQKVGPLHLKGVDGDVFAYRPSVPTRPQRCTLRRLASEVINIGDNKAVSKHITVIRRNELNSVIECIKEAANGGSATIVVKGTVGSGKTRFMDQIHDAAMDLRSEIIKAMCLEVNTRLSYYCIRQVLEGVIGVPLNRDAPWDVVKSTIQQMLPLELHMYLPVLNAVFQTSVFGNDSSNRPRWKVTEDRQRVLQRIIISLLRKRAQLCRSNNFPLTITVFDVQWCDSASWELLQELCQSSVSGVVVILLFQPTIPPDTATKRVDRKLHKMENNCDLLTIVLGKLSKADATTLICRCAGVSMVPDSVVDVIYSKAGGNCLFLIELTRHVLDTGLLKVVAGKLVATEQFSMMSFGGKRLHLAGGADEKKICLIPSTIQAICVSKIDRVLSANQALLLKSLAVFGWSSSVSLVKKIPSYVDADPSVLYNDLKALQRHGMIVLSTPGSTSHTLEDRTLGSPRSVSSRNRPTTDTGTSSPAISVTGELPTGRYFSAYPSNSFGGQRNMLSRGDTAHSGVHPSTSAFSSPAASTLFSPDMMSIGTPMQGPKRDSDAILRVQIQEEGGALGPVSLSSPVVPPLALTRAAAHTSGSDSQLIRSNSPDQRKLKQKSSRGRSLPDGTLEGSPDHSPALNANGSADPPMMGLTPPAHLRDVNFRSISPMRVTWQDHDRAPSPDVLTTVDPTFDTYSEMSLDDAGRLLERRESILSDIEHCPSSRKSSDPDVTPVLSTLVVPVGTSARAESVSPMPEFIGSPQNRARRGTDPSKNGAPRLETLEESPKPVSMPAIKIDLEPSILRPIVTPPDKSNDIPSVTNSLPSSGIGGPNVTVGAGGVQKDESMALASPDLRTPDDESPASGSPQEGMNPTDRRSAINWSSSPVSKNSPRSRLTVSGVPASSDYSDASSAYGISSSTTPPRVEREVARPKTVALSSGITGGLSSGFESEMDLTCTTSVGGPSTNRSSTFDTLTEGTTVSFTQQAMFESAYQLLPYEQRKALHKIAATHFEACVSGPAELQQRASLLAHHFDAADIPTKAIQYYELAAEVAFKSFAISEAIALFMEAFKRRDYVLTLGRNLCNPFGENLPQALLRVAGWCLRLAEAYQSRADTSMSKKLIFEGLQLLNIKSQRAWKGGEATLKCFSMRLPRLWNSTRRRQQATVRRSQKKMIKFTRHPTSSVSSRATTTLETQRRANPSLSKMTSVVGKMWRPRPREGSLPTGPYMLTDLLDISASDRDALASAFLPSGKRFSKRAQKWVMTGRPNKPTVDDDISKALLQWRGLLGAELLCRLAECALDDDSLDTLVSCSLLAVHSAARSNVVSVELARSLNMCGVASLLCGLRESAEIYLDHACAIADYVDSSDCIANCMHSRALVKMALGRHLETVTEFKKAQEIYRTLGHCTREEQTIVRLCDVYVLQGDRVSALTLAEKYLNDLSSDDATDFRCALLRVRGWALYVNGELRLALEALRESAMRLEEDVSGRTKDLRKKAALQSWLIYHLVFISHGQWFRGDNEDRLDTVLQQWREFSPVLRPILRVQELWGTVSYAAVGAMLACACTVVRMRRALDGVWDVTLPFHPPPHAARDRRRFNANDVDDTDISPEDWVPPPTKPSKKGGLLRSATNALRRTRQGLVARSVAKRCGRSTLMSLSDLALVEALESEHMSPQELLDLEIELRRGTKTALTMLGNLRRAYPLVEPYAQICRACVKLSHGEMHDASMMLQLSELSPSPLSVLPLTKARGCAAMWTLVNG
eukprot:Rmarinus@m.860